MTSDGNDVIRPDGSVWFGQFGSIEQLTNLVGDFILVKFNFFSVAKLSSRQLFSFASR